MFLCIRFELKLMSFRRKRQSNNCSIHSIYVSITLTYAVPLVKQKSFYLRKWVTQQLVAIAFEKWPAFTVGDFAKTRYYSSSEFDQAFFGSLPHFFSSFEIFRHFWSQTDVAQFLFLDWSSRKAVPFVPCKSPDLHSRFRTHVVHNQEEALSPWNFQEMMQILTYWNWIHELVDVATFTIPLFRQSKAATWYTNDERGMSGLWTLFMMQHENPRKGVALYYMFY